jgi:putative ABC transport system ATP-binding protein
MRDTRTAHPIKKRQVPFFALLEFFRRRESAIGANNAKGGSSAPGLKWSYTSPMAAFLECGPFSASDGEGRVLFDRVSLSLADGQFVAIEGPSGGGKSTLLRHVTALAFSLEAGRQLDGKSYDCARLPEWRSRVSLAAQDAPMIAGTVRDNLGLPFAQRAGREKRFDDLRAAALMTQVGLERLPFDREVRTLSGGERHRLALIRGLLWNPTVLVADEPLAGLDPEIASVCLDLILQFGRRPGRLVVCVLHDPGMSAHADRRLRLANGVLKDVT